MINSKKPLFNSKPDVENKMPAKRDKENNSRADLGCIVSSSNCFATRLFSMVVVSFCYLGVANYFKLFPFNGAQTLSNRSITSSDPGHDLKSLLKPLDMCMIDNASQWPFLKSVNVCEDEDIQINNCRTLHQPTYSVQHWQNLTTFNKDEQDFFHLRINKRRYQMSDGICYGFSAYFLATPTEKFFDQLHEFSYSETDYKKVYNDVISLNKLPELSEQSDLFIRTISLYQIMQTNQNNLIEIPPLIDFCFVEIVPIDKLPIMLAQLSDSQKIMVTNRGHAIAIQKIKYDTGEFAYLCIDYNLPVQFSPKSLDQAVDFYYYNDWEAFAF